METKKCPICQIEKTAAEYYSYYSKSRGKFRLSNYCIECSKKRGKKYGITYYEANKETRKQKVREYSLKPENKENLRKKSIVRKRKYRENLQACYVRSLLQQKSNIPNAYSVEFPEIVETKRLQIKIKRKLKTLKNGKE